MSVSFPLRGTALRRTPSDGTVSSTQRSWPLNAVITVTAAFFSVCFASPRPSDNDLRRGQEGLLNWYRQNSNLENKRSLLVRRIGVSGGCRKCVNIQRRLGVAQGHLDCFSQLLSCWNNSFFLFFFLPGRFTQHILRSSRGSWLFLAAVLNLMSMWAEIPNSLPMKALDCTELFYIYIYIYI